MLDFVNGDALRARCRACASTATRDQGTAEAELGRLAQSRFALAYRTHFAAQSDFAEYHHVGGYGFVGERRHYGCSDGEIGRRLADAQATRDIEIDVVGADRDPAAR